MHSTQCPDCNQSFSRKDVMLRHQRCKHKAISRTYLQISGAHPPPQEALQGPPPPPPPPPPPQEALQGAPLPPPPQEALQGTTAPQYELPPPQQGVSVSTLCNSMDNKELQPMILQHPFTMMISGPTACGKTTFVKDLLQKHTVRIQPTMHRIVWLYKRWQPLYTLIKRTVTPTVEFIQGIPTDLDDDNYFDPKINNLLILDDLFSESGKDKKVTDLFTEGSHHRSLSVVSINQNLFGNKDPTQRRNCHYLVLFSNPVDRLSLMTLARQMYPRNTEIFLKRFRKATKYPFTFLLVDLKPFTAEEDRLRHDVKWRDQVSTRSESTNQLSESLQKPIKETEKQETDHCSIGVQTVHIDEEVENMMADKAQACDDCGVLFDSVHDVQRHVKRGWCPEANEPPAKKTKTEDSINVIDEDIEDNEGYKHLWHLAQNCSKDRFNKLYDQYMDIGDNADDASQEADERTQPYREKDFFQRYQTLLEVYWFPLMSNATHRGIVEQINAFRVKGVSLTSAAKSVLKKNKNAFEDLFELEDSDESEEDTDSEDSE